MRIRTLLLASLSPALSFATLGAQTQPASPIVTFSGELRSRSEWDEPGPNVNRDLFTYLRTRLGVRVDINTGTHVLLQVQDSRVLGAEETNSSTHVLDLHQAYADLTGTWKNADVSARAGRQEIALGNERLVGVVNWSNTGRSFDGARFTMAQQKSGAGASANASPTPWSTSLFIATVEERGRHFGTTTAASTSDHFAAALFGTRGLTVTETIDGTLLYDASARYRTFTNSSRTTLDSRFRSTRLTGFAFELEGAAQFGNQDYAAASGSTTTVHQQVSAWLAGARFGKTSFTSKKATLGVGADLLSGDDTPSDDRYGAFSTMFASNHAFYGLMDVIGDPAATTRERGLVDVFGNGSVVLNQRTSLKAELHRFELNSGDVKPLAWEFDLTVPVKLGAAANLDIGYSALRGDKAAPVIGIGADGKLRHWAYLQLRAGF
jgi:hypothetical protein